MKYGFLKVIDSDIKIKKVLCVLLFNWNIELGSETIAVLIYNCCMYVHQLYEINKKYIVVFCVYS